MSDELKVICAWCGRWLRGPKDGIVTHSICEECKAEQLRLLEQGSKVIKENNDSDPVEARVKEE